MKINLILILLLCALTGRAGTVDDLRQALQQSSVSQVQEKVYIHTDNECYFVGDTLWYKAYVVRADNLMPTDMSRILYVELLSPDGLLVERQNIIVSGKGYTCGQFTLPDSLYSGYYELRAYTRWMLNFNVSHQRYSKQDTWYFYNKEMAADYFRQWEGLYSRVFPIYSKPERPGDYDARRMYQRPKQRLPQPKKDKLVATFYPEGGHLIQGVENRVAFALTDQYGEAVNLQGTLTGAGAQPVAIRTEHGGRGSISVTPAGQTLKAHFTFRGKEYDFPLPDAEPAGVAMLLDDGGKLTLAGRNLSTDKQYAVSILCRGVLKYFTAVNCQLPQVSLAIPIDSLPTGVNELTLFDGDGRIWASRLFFVNHHESDASLIVSVDSKPAQYTYQPYEEIEYSVQCGGVTEPTVFSLSIRDTNTDEPTYNNGNIMTDLLLSSDLRGFIARPAYYFEADDAVHRRHLDLLMMVQGWRKYKWQELADTAREMRYQPEKTMTVEGLVCKTLSVDDVEPDEVGQWQDGLGGRGTSVTSTEVDDEGNETEVTSTAYDNILYANDEVGINHKGVRREVLVEAEVCVGEQVVGSTQKTNGGRFLFEIPPFYGGGYLNMKAYSQNDSIKKNMASRKDAKVYDEKAYPDYFVKRDLFYPMTTQPYDFYQNHIPDFDGEQLIDTLSDLSMENDVHQLANVNVKGHRRGRRAIDWKKPAYVLDAYDIYNELTDRGLSFGRFDMRMFPLQVCHWLYGNMHIYRTFNVDGRLENFTYWRNYSPTNSGAGEAEAAGVFRANRTPQSIYPHLLLSRLQDVRVFSDYEPRNPDSTQVINSLSADATVEMVPIPSDGRQLVFRDRHIWIQGFNMPEAFYQPDYSNRPVDERPADYRRTLYWNPNAVTDEEGRFTAVFYNNGKQTRVRMSACGIAADGRLLHSK
jgi:hypothetical protein